MKADLSPFVDRLASHSQLNEAEQDALLALPAQLLTVDAHRDFVRLNETVDHVSVVIDGVIGRFGQNAEGERQLIALHIAGDAPDLHLMVVPRGTVPLQALSNARVLRVPHPALREVTARYPAIAEALWRHCSIDAGITARWVLNLGRRDAKTRIAHLLCEMAVRYDAIADGGAVTFAATASASFSKNGPFRIAAQRDGSNC